MHNLMFIRLATCGRTLLGIAFEDQLDLQNVPSRLTVVLDPADELARRDKLEYHHLTTDLKNALGQDDHERFKMK
jgi:hypothetical protein